MLSELSACHQGLPNDVHPCLCPVLVLSCDVCHKFPAILQTNTRVCRRAAHGERMQGQPTRQAMHSAQAMHACLLAAHATRISWQTRVATATPAQAEILKDQPRTSPAGRPHALAAITPVSTKCGTSAASHGARPKHRACATPKCGLRGQGGPSGRPPAGRVHSASGRVYGPPVMLFIHSFTHSTYGTERGCRKQWTAMHA